MIHCPDICKKHIREIFLIIYVFCFLICILSGCFGHEVQNFRENYAKKYSNELAWTFGKNYKISDKKEKVIEAFECDCGYHEPEVRYYEWEITYTDQEGKEYKVEMDNWTDWREQKAGWITERVEEYYSDQIMKCVTKYNKDVSDVYAVEIDDIYSGEYSEELEQWYKEQNEEQTAFSLYDMDYANVFRDFPMYIEVDITLQKNGRVREDKLKEIISRLNEETGKTCNMQIEIDREDDDDFYRQYTIIRGKEAAIGEWEEMLEEEMWWV